MAVIHVKMCLPMPPVQNCRILLAIRISWNVCYFWCCPHSMWSGRASVRLSHRSTAATVADGFAAERWCLQQLSFDSCSVADAVSILLRADGGRSTVYTDIDIDYFSYNVYLLANKLMMSCLYLFFFRNRSSYTSDGLASWWAAWCETAVWNARALWSWSCNDTRHGNSNAAVIWSQHWSIQTTPMASATTEHSVWLTDYAVNFQ